MEYLVNHTTLQYHAEGERAFGSETVLLDQSIDLTQKTSWTGEGFSIENLFEEEKYQQFEAASRDLLLTLWRQARLNAPSSIALDQYHQLISQYADHLNAIERTKLLPVEDFPLDIRLLEERISSICHEKLEVKNPFDSQSVFHFRIIRPNTTDNNPLHRDVWLADYRDCINLYIPIAGSDEDSSIILIPGSHRWAESKVERTLGGAVIKGVRFNVPAVTSIRGDFKAIRPNPGRNEVLVFSPYLIHGGAINLSPAKTRISIEIRLWKKS
jgi:hypothetical protein